MQNYLKYHSIVLVVLSKKLKFTTIGLNLFRIFLLHLNLQLYFIENVVTSAAFVVKDFMNKTILLVVSPENLNAQFPTLQKNFEIYLRLKIQLKNATPHPISSLDYYHIFPLPTIIFLKFFVSMNLKEILFLPQQFLYFLPLPQEDFISVLSILQNTMYTNNITDYSHLYFWYYQYYFCICFLIFCKQNANNVYIRFLNYNKNAQVAAYLTYAQLLATLPRSYSINRVPHKKLYVKYFTNILCIILLFYSYYFLEINLL